MEYKVITPKDKVYPDALKERLGADCPEYLYYLGPLEYINTFTLAVISADAIGGVGMMHAHQPLFTIREFSMNYISSWHSFMEFEILRLCLWRKTHNTVTLFSAKGLENESFEGFMNQRNDPRDITTEIEHYFKLAEEGKLLMFSVAGPQESRQTRENIMQRNWIACCLADAVFVPYALKNSKTFTTAKKVKELGIPIFTTDCPENKALHDAGIPVQTRKSVGDFLSKLGAKLASELPKDEWGKAHPPVIAKKNRIGQLEFLKVSENNETTKYG